MFRLTNYHNEARGTVLSLLTSKSDASLYQHWLVLHRLKTKGLIDPHRMEPFEDGFPTSRYLFSVVYPLAAVLPSRILNRRLHQTFCRLQLHLRSLIRLALALICFVHDQTVERKG
jgi:hypothetical protein